MNQHDGALWPKLSGKSLAPTIETLQLWAQVVGKIRLARTPWLNHSWHATLYVTARGLTTSLIQLGRVSLELTFDFVAGELVLRVTDGGERRVALAAGSVASFYAKLQAEMKALGTPVGIVEIPNELPDAIPFRQDTRPRTYDSAAAREYWLALVQVERVFSRFRTRFLGKSTPAHLFWGGFDLAVTRFSGRRAPLHPGGIPHLPDAVTREAYSHEEYSAGFWSGSGGPGEPSFYSYIYPTPPGFASAVVVPEAARFDATLGEFLLPYEAVRTARDPDEALLGFLQSTYEAAADLAGWDRAALDCEEGQLGRPRSV